MPNESGHAKNVSTFAQLISDVRGFGSAYNPSSELIETDALDERLELAQDALSAVNVAGADEINAVNERSDAFEPLTKFITRIGNASAVNVNDASFAVNLKTLTRKLQGRRAEPKPVADPDAPTAEAATPTVSAAQTSFDNREANFASLIALLKTQPDYAPNEADLKTTALDTRLSDLQTKNQAVRTAAIAAANARTARNEILYNPQTGLVTRANLVKKYVKSVFGTNSPQHQQISGLQFTSRKLT